MKTTLFWLLLLLFATPVSIPSSLAQDTEPERTVRVIYFLPSGTTPQSNINTTLDQLIKDVQKLYADEMERHGHGRKTFTIETDDDGNAVVHHVNGQFANVHYYQNTHGKVTKELDEQFDASKNIYMVVIEIASESFEDGDACGNASNRYGEIGGGYTLIPASGHCVAGDSGIGFAAHELGHNFGLPHDFSSDNYIMSYGGHLRSVFSACAAGWLTAHRLQPALLEAQLEALRAKSDGTLKYQRAIAFFQSLLTIARPNKTALLANYPNPFNPETWIPYQLAQDSKVSITIYDARGIPVRQLALGHCPAGDYTDRTRAAYWDGRNTQGEPVASGLYFYQLQTDTHSLLRKMVIKK